MGKLNKCDEFKIDPLAKISYSYMLKYEKCTLLIFLIQDGHNTYICQSFD
jgi:hypothetical protein